MELFADSLANTESSLYLVLTISVMLLTIFVCVALIYLILIFRDVSKILDKTRDTAEKINEFVLKPVSIISMVVDRVRPIVEAVMDRQSHAQLEDTRPKKKKK